MTLALVFHIRPDDGKGIAGTLDSPDQGAAGIPISSATLDKGEAHLTVPRLGGEFVGRPGPDGATLTGTWRQGPASLLLVLKHQTGPVVGRLRPQEPKPPFPYRAVDVAFDNPAAPGLRLAATLTLPAGAGPFPTAVLITGSGPQNRDEEVFGHKPFLVLADYLTRRGVAVLRVDDRGIGASTGAFSKATTPDFATDTQAGVQFLKSRPDINPRRIGLIGHSEGGLIAAMLAADDPSIAWIVMMAGPGLPGHEIIARQQALIGTAMGAPPEAIAADNRSERRLLDLVMQAPDAASARASAKAFLLKSGDTEAEAERSAAQVSSDWFRWFIRHDPADDLRRVRAPILAIDGSLDLQVPPEADLKAIKAASRASRGVTTVELPGLNHLFQSAKTGAPSEYGQIDETLAPAALRTIGDWIKAR